MSFKDIINTACCDDRIENGIINLSNVNHLFILEEYLIKNGFPVDIVTEKLSKIINEKGNFPDRQAYNKDGILVTFPNREYKQRAIERGTHFEKNPKPFATQTRKSSSDNNNATQYDTQNNGSLFTSDDTAYQLNKIDDDSISLEDELRDSGEGIETGDLRSKEEKIQDAEAVESIFGINIPTAGVIIPSMTE